MKARLTKSKTDRIIDGVCGGLAEYFDIDPVIVRLIFVILVFVHGIGLLLYIVLVIIMPKAEKADRPPDETIRDNVQEIEQRVKEVGESLSTGLSLEREDKGGSRARWLGAVLILLGIFFLMQNFKFFWWIDMDVFLSLILIFIGSWLLITRLRGKE